MGTWKRLKIGFDVVFLAFDCFYFFKSLNNNDTLSIILWGILLFIMAGVLVTDLE